MKPSLKAQGFVRTPPCIATLLVHWALRTPTDHVLDAGFGEGIFLLESTKQLLALGATAQHLGVQLHGVDSHPEAVQSLQQTFRTAGLPTAFPGVHTGDFFATDFPPVDVLIGNPPYVRRWWQQDVDALQVIAGQVEEARAFSRLTDLACYFILYGARFLKPGGRLALIVSDSCLDMRYGTAFKEYLLRTFHVRGLLGFQAQVFPDVLVRPVVILAEKRAAPAITVAGERVAFVSLNGCLPATLPADPCHLLTDTQQEVSGRIVPLTALYPAQQWTPLLYAPQVYSELAQHPGLTTLATLAQVRLGLQSFAKMFYIVPREVQERWGLEARWLLPFMMSPKDVDAPCLSPGTAIRHYILACAASKSQLAGTHLLEYICYWEQQTLNPRGLSRPVIGVQNLPRVGRTRRTPWYSLMRDLTRRGTAPILLPRRIYQHYQAVWNQAAWVAGENFIEVTPQPHVPLLPLLAVLNAGTTEMALRASAHVYGGGVYNLSPGSVGAVPVVDVRQLSSTTLQRLEKAYRHFLHTGGTKRLALDTAVLNALALPRPLLTTVQAALAHMQELSSAVQTPMRVQAGTDRGCPEECTRR